MRQYRGKWVFPLARLFKALCHPSRSLFVLTASMNTLQVVGDDVSFLIQLSATYSTNFFKESVVARR